MRCQTKGRRQHVRPSASFHIANTGCATVQPGVLGPCDTPIKALTWSPDGKWLLVEELGLNTGSTSPPSDDYVVHVRTMRLSKVASTYEILWLPGSDELLYTTPRDSAELPGTHAKRTVWVQQFMLFNPATSVRSAITSGLSNNHEPSACSP